MVADVGETQARWDAHRAGGRGQQHRLRHAERLARAEHGTGPVGGRLAQHLVRVVTDFVPDRREQPRCPDDVAVRVTGNSRGEGEHRRMQTVNELRRGQIAWGWGSDSEGLGSGAHLS